MSKLLSILALWFLADWAYKSKLKPFLATEFGLPANTQPSKKADTLITSPVPYNKIPGMNSGTYTWGLDISRYQSKAEVENILNKYIDSIKYIFCKATDATHADPAFFTNWSLVVDKAGLIRGTYHFYHQETGAIEQAVYYVNALRFIGYSDDDLPPVVDFEINQPDPAKHFKGSNVTSLSDTQHTKATQDSLLVFLTQVEYLLKRKPLIYASQDIAAKLAAGSKLGSYSFWIARYDKEPPYFPLQPAYWSFWQKTDKYVPAKGDTLDFDVFNGNMAALNLFINDSVKE